MEALSAKLAEITGRTSAAHRAAGETASVRLIALRGQIAAARTALSARLSALETVTDLLSRHTAARVLASSESALITSAQRAIDEGQSALSTATQNLRNRQDAVRQQTYIVTRLHAEVSLLTGMRADLERLAELQYQLTDLVGEISAVESDLAARQAELNQIEATLEGGRTRRSQLAQLESTWAKAKADLELCRQLAELERVEASAKAAADAAVQAAAVARAREVALAEERDRLVSAISTANQQLNEARARATAMAAAVARIASHLGPHDDHCPICATPFAPEDLKLTGLLPRVLASKR
jgi:chromosome segregation ATPase